MRCHAGGVGTDPHQAKERGTRWGQGHPSFSPAERLAAGLGSSQAPSLVCGDKRASYPMAPLTYFPSKVSPPSLTFIFRPCPLGHGPHQGRAACWLLSSLAHSPEASP